MSGGHEFKEVTKSKMRTMESWDRKAEANGCIEYDLRR
jgi:hypothetical protein